LVVHPQNKKGLKKILGSHNCHENSRQIKPKTRRNKPKSINLGVITAKFGLILAARNKKKPATINSGRTTHKKTKEFARNWRRKLCHNYSEKLKVAEKNKLIENIQN